MHYIIKPFVFLTHIILGSYIVFFISHHTKNPNELTTHSKVEEDTIIYDNTVFPEGNFPIALLRVGIFHNDEVPLHAVKKTWIGLFRGESGHYLKQTNINTKNVHDPILDENENIKTGWEITVRTQDDCVLLMEPSTLFDNRKVEAIQLTTDYIYPEDTITFTFSGTEYTIFASGGKNKISDEPLWYDVWNYKLYLRTMINGKQTTTLLVAQPNFSQQMVYIMFIGDIDGDNKPDLIIDTSRHYNVSNPTLYLSKPAVENELVKPVGQFTSVGC